MFEMVFHRLELLGRMRLPITNLAEDPQRMAGAVGFRRIAREFLVRQVRIVFERAGRRHDIDPSPTLAQGQLRPQIAASSVPVR